MGLTPGDSTRFGYDPGDRQISGAIEPIDVIIDAWPQHTDCLMREWYWKWDTTQWELREDSGASPTDLMSVKWCGFTHCERWWFSHIIDDLTMRFDGNQMSGSRHHGIIYERDLWYCDCGCTRRDHFHYQIVLKSVRNASRMVVVNVIVDEVSLRNFAELKNFSVPLLRWWGSEWELDIV